MNIIVITLFDNTKFYTNNPVYLCSLQNLEFFNLEKNEPDYIRKHEVHNISLIDISELPEHIKIK